MIQKAVTNTITVNKKKVWQSPQIYILDTDDNLIGAVKHAPNVHENTGHGTLHTSNNHAPNNPANSFFTNAASNYQVFNRSSAAS